jgi:hypothetical protein
MASLQHCQHSPKSNAPLGGRSLGGAALQRCGNCLVLTSALAAEVTLSARKLVFQQPV